MSTRETILGNFRLGASPVKVRPVSIAFGRSDFFNLRELRIGFEGDKKTIVVVKCFIPPGSDRIARAAYECGRGAAIYLNWPQEVKNVHAQYGNGSG